MKSSPSKAGAATWREISTSGDDKRRKDFSPRIQIETYHHDLVQLRKDHEVRLPLLCPYEKLKLAYENLTKQINPGTTRIEISPCLDIANSHLV